MSPPIRSCPPRKARRQRRSPLGSRWRSAIGGDPDVGIGGRVLVEFDSVGSEAQLPADHRVAFDDLLDREGDTSGTEALAARSAISANQASVRSRSRGQGRAVRHRFGQVSEALPIPAARSEPARRPSHDAVTLTWRLFGRNSTSDLRWRPLRRQPLQVDVTQGRSLLSWCHHCRA